MKILFRVALVLFILFASIGVYAQYPTTVSDEVYGHDPLLYNGRFYTYFLPAGTEGTPFIHGPGFVKGSVTLRGVTYDSLSLNYDVFNQQLVLQYKTSIGADNLIALSDAWLESFDLGATHFEILALEDTLKRIYQVMGNGPNRVLYSWGKELAIDFGVGIQSYRLTKSERLSYLLIGTELSKYRNNGSFAALFGPAKRTIIKKYLRQQKIKLKKASDQLVSELINYCNTLPE